MDTTQMSQKTQNTVRYGTIYCYVDDAQTSATKISAYDQSKISP